MVTQLDEMHAHEIEHYEAFGKLMLERHVRTVIAPVFWCAGGIVYGVVTALAGRRAVWRSTAVIESIVERELKEAAEFFESRDDEIYQTIQRILTDEEAHRVVGEQNSPGTATVDKLVTPVAQAGASVSKGLAERL